MYCWNVTIKVNKIKRMFIKMHSLGQGLSQCFLKQGATSISTPETTYLLTYGYCTVAARIGRNKQ